MGRIRNHFTRKNPKVSASSLVETIVATVIRNLAAAFGQFVRLTATHVTSQSC